jgi:hypothetical protein
MVLYALTTVALDFSCCWSRVSARLVSICCWAGTEFDFSWSKVDCFAAMRRAVLGGLVGSGSAGVLWMMASFLCVVRVWSFPHMRVSCG